MKFFRDFTIGGAWPFLVGGVICLVYSVNERDCPLYMGLSAARAFVPGRRNHPLRATIGVKSMEVGGNNRSVMPLDVPGRTRATLREAASGLGACPWAGASRPRGGLGPWARAPGTLHNLPRDGDRRLELFVLNEENIVIAVH